MRPEFIIIALERTRKYNVREVHHSGRTLPVHYGHGRDVEPLESVRREMFAIELKRSGNILGSFFEVGISENGAVVYTG